MKDKALIGMFAYLLMRNINHTEYGTLHKAMKNQYSLVNDQSPKTVLDATEIMDIYMHIEKNKPPQQGRNNNNEGLKDDTK